MTLAPSSANRFACACLIAGRTCPLHCRRGSRCCCCAGCRCWRCWRASPKRCWAAPRHQRRRPPAPAAARRAQSFHRFRPAQGGAQGSGNVSMRKQHSSRNAVHSLIRQAGPQNGRVHGPYTRAHMQTVLAMYLSFPTHQRSLPPLLDRLGGDGRDAHGALQLIIRRRHQLVWEWEVERWRVPACRLRVRPPSFPWPNALACV